MNRSFGPRAAAPPLRPRARRPSEWRAPRSPPRAGVVIFGSAKPVTCAVMDYARRLREAIKAQAARLRRHRDDRTGAPVRLRRRDRRGARAGRIAHLQLPIEGWGNSVVAGFGAVRGARADAARPHRHHAARMDLAQLAALSLDDPRSRGGRRLRVRLAAPARRVSCGRPGSAAATKAAAPVIPIGPNIMPARIDPAKVDAERARLMGEGAHRADLSSASSACFMRASGPICCCAQRARCMSAASRRDCWSAAIFSGTSRTTARPSSRSRAISASSIGSTSAAGSTTRAI